MTKKRGARGNEVSQRPSLQGVRVLIAEDHKLFADAMTLMLQRQGMQVVGITTSGNETIEAARRFHPEVLLVDLGLPDASGLSVGQEILEELPDTTVIAVTALKSNRAVKQAFEVGFQGYLTKDTPLNVFTGAILSALHGKVVAAAATEGRNGRASSWRQLDGPLPARQLTSRERQVLSLLAEGTSSEEVATRLAISRNTVRSHIQSILTKLQVHSRLEAVVYAVRHNFIEPSDHSS